MHASTDSTNAAVNSPVVLAPTFDANPNASMRTGSVVNGVSSVTLTAMPNHPGAMISITPADASSSADNHQVSLTAGAVTHHNPNGNGGGRQHEGLHHKGVPQRLHKFYRQHAKVADRNRSER